MTLAPQEADRFYRVWWTLLSYVNSHVHLMKELPPEPPPESVNPNDLLPVRNALWKDDSLRERFISENPHRLSPDDLDLVASWSRRVEGEFYAYRELKKHTVLLAARGPAKAYGVLGIVSPIPEAFWQPLPVLVEAVLLPFEDRVTYDSLMRTYPLTFGPGIRSSLDDQYRAARERGGV